MDVFDLTDDLLGAAGEATTFFDGMDAGAGLAGTGFFAATGFFAGAATFLTTFAGAFLATSIEEGDAELRARAAGVTRSVYDEDRKDRLNEYALYGEASYDLGGGWKVGCGA